MPKINKVIDCVNFIWQLRQYGTKFGDAMRCNAMQYKNLQRAICNIKILFVGAGVTRD